MRLYLFLAALGVLILMGMEVYSQWDILGYGGRVISLLLLSIFSTVALLASGLFDMDEPS